MTACELASERLRLRVEPAVGGSLLDLSLRSPEGWLPLLRRAPEPLRRSSDAASFVMAPWSNRVRDGRFFFERREHRLRHPEKHAIHGDVRDRPWAVRAQGAAELRLALDAGALPDLNFPFPFAAEQRLALRAARFEQELRLLNTGSTRMPAGGGFHPYFLHALGDAKEEARLETRLGGVYPGETPLPSGPPRRLPPELDHGRLRPVARGLDHCFSEWSGRALLEWPASGVRARIEANPPLRHLVLYTPPDQPFFALEPVSHAIDGFNLLAAGQPGTGVAVLEPGAALVLGWSLEIESPA